MELKSSKTETRRRWSVAPPVCWANKTTQNGRGGIKSEENVDLVGVAMVTRATHFESLSPEIREKPWITDLGAEEIQLSNMWFVTDEVQENDGNLFRVTTVTRSVTVDRSKQRKILSTVEKQYMVERFNTELRDRRRTNIFHPQTRLEKSVFSGSCWHCIDIHHL